MAKREGSEQPVSFWHDVPLEAEGGGFNMVVEIPKFSKAKMEIDLNKEHNPIIQDTKNGALRDYHGPIFWNYGALPQTWEDPEEIGGTEVFGSGGDNDPVDVVEIGTQAIEMGSIVPVKVLGALAMIDDGELDWKLLVLALSDPLADKINEVDDIEKHLPHTLNGVREWFRWYNTPDGKPLNRFGYDEEILGREFAEGVIQETHKAWRELRIGERKGSPKYYLGAS